MRSDMKDIIIDVTRKGADVFPKNRHFDEDSPTKVSIRPKGDAERKSQDDRLAPLRRALSKNVGRPWDKVYSEICANNSLHTLRGYHLRLHVEYFVTLDCRREGKRIVDPAGRALCYPEFYVLNGILHQLKDKKKYKFQKVEFTPYWKMDGVWYELTFTEFKASKRGQFDEFFKKYFYNTYQIPYGKSVVASGKRQLNSREIKKLGLNNA